MAWQDELIPTLRVMIGDLDETAFVYSDDSLEQILLVAAKQVATTISFEQTFVISVQNGTLTPDPTVGANTNDGFVNLFSIKAAAILDRTEASLAARRGISVKDGTSAIDLSKVALAKIRLLDKGWNAVYDDAVFEYRYLRAQTVAGAMVLGPFRLYANQRWGGSPSFGERSGGFSTL